MKGQTNYLVLNNKLPQTLRRNLTDAERHLWRCLRGKQMHGYKFRRQHAYGNYILDFVCLEARLVIEVDGGQHAEQAQQDVVRSIFLGQAGFRVLRFWNNEVLSQLEAVQASISLALLESIAPHPHPGPPLEGEGVA